MGRVLGVDYGERRIGFALSDPTEFLASAHSVSECRNEGEALKAVAGVFKATGAERIVLGLPVNMDGSHGPAAQKVKSFGEKLAAATGTRVEYWDERLSTRSAQDALIEAGTRREKRKGLVDKVAAQIMLQNYLDARSPGPWV